MSVCILNAFVNYFWMLDDSDDDEKVVRKKGRQVRQAASKAASKQREILLGDGGSEEEEGEEEEDEDDSDVYTGGANIFSALYSQINISETSYRTRTLNKPVGYYLEHFRIIFLLP